MLNNQNSINKSLIIENASRLIYLHFFDSQLLGSLGAYNSLPVSMVYRDLLLLLMSTYESLYMSSALIFENKFAQYSLKRLLPLFQRGHIQLAMKDNSLRDLILTKRNQYYHVKEIYPFYWNDTWKKIGDLGLSYKSKQIDTTQYLASSILPDLQTQGIKNSASRMGIEINDLEINNLLPYTLDSIINRNTRAITKSLFKKQYESLEISFSTQRCFNIKISEHYVKAYLSEFDGTIATGLFSGIEHFSYLCPTFPLHHISLWHDIYSRIGLLSVLENFSSQEIAIIREDVEFQDFVDEIRFFIMKSIEQHYVLLPESYSSNTAIVAFLGRKIRGSFKGFTTISHNIDGFLNTLRKVTSFLKSLDIEDQPINTYQQRELDDKMSERHTSKGNDPEITWYQKHIDNLTKAIMSEKETPKYDQRGAKISIGSYVDQAHSSSTQSGTSNQNNYDAPDQNLAEAAAEIQQLLEHLASTYASPTDTEKMIVVTQAADQIQCNQNLKAKVVNAIKSGGTRALKEAIDNPLANILFALIDGWNEI